MPLLEPVMILGMTFVIVVILFAVLFPILQMHHLNGCALYTLHSALCALQERLRSQQKLVQALRHLE